MKPGKIFTYSIFRQMVLFTVLISIVPIIFISLILYRRMDRLMMKELDVSHSQLMTQYGRNVEEKLEQYESSLGFIGGNTIICDALSGEDGDENAYVRGERISTEVTKSLFLERSGEIRNCMVYSNVWGVPVYGTRAAMKENARIEGWYGTMGLQEGIYTYRAQDAKPVLSMVKQAEKVDLNSFHITLLGWVKLDIRLDQLFEPANQDYMVLVSRGQDVLYTSGVDGSQAFAGLDLTDGKKWNQVMVKQMDLDHGFQVTFLFPLQELAKKKQELHQVVLPMVLGLLFLILAGAWLFTRRFARRLGGLTEKLKVAETGDLSPGPPIGGRDEIAYLDRKFTHMLNKLNELIKRNYIQGMENKEAQLRNLQLQINPHFLYNTLETISSMAAVKNVFDVCDMCHWLGEIFRYCLGKDYGEYVTLGEELHHTQNFIFIEKVRLRERLKVYYHVELDVEAYLVLRFILQPMVENSINHGLRSITGVGTLDVTIREEGGCLLIKVEDDGVGMNANRVEELERYMNQTDNGADRDMKSIGIRNLNQRIKMACGQEYGVRIESEPYQGSCFSIWMPLMKKGGGADGIQASDRG